MKTKYLLATALLWLAVGPGRARQSKPAADVLRRAGETTVFAFVTKSGKTASLCQGPKGTYLVYRFGTAAKTELQYPAVLDAISWHKFTYSSYFRGGGAANAGLDLNRLTFRNGGVKYQMHHDYSAEDEAKNGDGTDVGLEVTVQGKTTRIPAKDGTVVGSLLDFRDNPKIVTGELD